MPDQVKHHMKVDSLHTGAPLKGFSVAGECVIVKLLENVGTKTDEDLNARFGISYNTWCKLMAGRPVRKSLLSRLEHRLGLEGV